VLFVVEPEEQADIVTVSRSRRAARRMLVTLAAVRARRS